VLFHGLTNCPQQFDAFARLLHARGETVYVPRLPFHGHKDRLTKEIAGLTAAQIANAAMEAAAFGRALGERVNVLGISVGATMALELAQAGGVEHAVAIAPFLMVPVLPRPPGMLLMHVLHALPDFFVWWDPRLRERIQPPYAYPGFHTHCLSECVFAGASIFAGAASAAPAAPRCTIVVNAHDPAVNNALASQLAARWKTHGASYQLEVWDDLGKVHDVIDPTTYTNAERLVYPRLITLLES
jgi:pimeloyl-ACP methyl ester carboxylesterase